LNHKNTTLAIAAIVAAVALTGVAFAIPQQVMAGGHRHGHNHDSNGVKVDQQVNQENQCNGQQPKSMDLAAPQNPSEPSTTCVNLGENQADIGH